MTAIPAGLASRIGRHAATGRLAWIGLRPAKGAPVEAVEAAEIGAAGLIGDHRSAGAAGPRAVTLIQAEHLPVIAALAARADAPPALLRRNLVVAGINLAALRHGPLRIGAATLRITGPCPPCSRMEAALGAGGWNAMRGHGGFYAEVLAAGRVACGDEVAPG
mgnify:CR=1 FL=1